jgi:hypothetical protein
MNKEDFIKKLRIVASKDTSADPEGWTSGNPLWGHCAVASLLAQDYFGGELMRGALDGHPKYARLRSHFWNSIPEEVDFTAGQYLDLKFSELLKEPRDRERVLSHPDTQRRYALLKGRFQKFI